jgi:hypothetical protein
MIVHFASSDPRAAHDARDEAGMVTSEYAVDTFAACAVAGVLLTMAPGLIDFFSKILEAAFGPIMTALPW